MQRRKLLAESGAGVLLLEMCICLAILSVVASGAVPSFVRVRQSIEATNAKTRVLAMAQLQTALAVCGQTIGCVQNPALLAQVPNIPAGTAQVLQQGAFLYSYQNVGGGFWIYQATAQGSIFSPVGTNYWTDTVGTVRCGVWPSGSAC